MQRKLDLTGDVGKRWIAYRTKQTVPGVKDRLGIDAPFLQLLNGQNLSFSAAIEAGKRIDTVRAVVKVGAAWRRHRQGIQRVVSIRQQEVGMVEDIKEICP